MITERNEYGFPVVDRLAWAKQYAAEAKERNRPPCDCEGCRLREIEPAVIQIIQRWT